MPQLPVVLTKYSLAKLDLLYGYFRSAETAYELKSNSPWFSRQNSKYHPNLNLKGKKNLVKGYRCLVLLCGEKIRWHKCF